MGAGQQLFAEGTPLPRLRADLVISRQQLHGQTNFVVKDPISLRYFRLGPPERHLAELLDGRRTLPEVTAGLQEKFPGDGFDDAAVGAILMQFLRMSFLQLNGEQAQQYYSYLRALAQRQKRQSLPLRALSSVISFKISLFDPDLMLLRLEKRLRWVWSNATMMTLAALLTTALWLVAANPERLTARLPEFLTLHNLFWLWTTMIGVKVVHEFGHGLACKHYGGEVHDMGALFIVFTPFLFCDATDSWMFPNKWHRVVVNMAGIIVELFVASLATILWAVTPLGLTNQLCLNIMVVCSIHTVVFNANPLMKFDGYYALADWLEVPNLRSRAGQFITNLSTRWITGEPPMRLVGATTTRRVLLALFGVASYLYSVTIIYRLSRGIGSKLEPYGLAPLGQFAAVSTVSVGFILPIVAMGRHLRRQLAGPHAGFVRRRLLIAGGIATLVLATLFLAPWRRTVTSSCVLDSNQRTAVRATVAGFVRAVRVREGDRVASNQVVAVLENPELDAQAADIADRQAILTLLRQRAQADGNASALARLNADQREMEAQRERLGVQRAGLELRAPQEGVVLTPDLTTRRGELLRDGDLWGDLLPTHRLRIIVPLTETEAGLVRTGQSVRLAIYARPGEIFHGIVTKTFLANSPHLPHAALAARHGGEVPTEILPTASGMVNEQPVGSLYQAELQIDNTAGLLRPGMSGRARIECGHTTLAHVVWSKLRALVRLDLRV
jgi:putative peptide zinc metalloprotease protein